MCRKELAREDPNNYDKARLNHTAAGKKRSADYFDEFTPTIQMMTAKLDETKPELKNSNLVGPH